MLSGITLFRLQYWLRAFQLWFMLRVAIFMIDSLAEKCWRHHGIGAVAAKAG